MAVQEPITDTMAVHRRRDGTKSYECQYRDAKVATMSAVQKPKYADSLAAEADEDTDEAVRLTNASCVTGIKHVDAFFGCIEVEMQRRSAQLAALSLVNIADGASRMWIRVADLAERGQQVWHILGFWHACEHLATIARWLYGEGSERCTESFRRWRAMLRESHGAEVIAELTTLRDSGEYPALHADIQGEIDYFTANQQRMDYRRYRELGLPIGSGTVESACKVRQANWHMTEGESPLERRSNRSTFLREPCAGTRKGKVKRRQRYVRADYGAPKSCIIWSAETLLHVEGNTGRGWYGETRPGSTASENSCTHARHMSGLGRSLGRPGGSLPGPQRKGARPDQRCTTRRSQTWA